LHGYGYEDEGNDDQELIGVQAHRHGHGPGTAPEHVYEANMVWWRAGMRRYLVGNLPTESRWIAAMQVSIESRGSTSQMRRVSLIRSEWRLLSVILSLLGVMEYSQGSAAISVSTKFN
jgi:hypothetical protein